VPIEIKTALFDCSTKWKQISVGNFPPAGKWKWPQGNERKCSEENITEK